MSSVNVTIVTIQADGHTSMKLLAAKNVCIGFRNTSLNARDADSGPVRGASATDCNDTLEVKERKPGQTQMEGNLLSILTSAGLFD